MQDVEIWSEQVEVSTVRSYRQILFIGAPLGCKNVTLDGSCFLGLLTLCLVQVNLPVGKSHHRSGNFLDILHGYNVHAKVEKLLEVVLVCQDFIFVHVQMVVQSVDHHLVRILVQAHRRHGVLLIYFSQLPFESTQNVQIPHFDGLID